MSTIKVCSKCKIAKDVAQFSKSKIAKDGVRSECKQCNRLYYEANKDRILRRERAWFVSNPDYKRTWREANKVRIAEYDKQYLKDNPEKRRAKRQRRRARQKNALTGYYTDRDLQELHIEYQGRCAYCFGVLGSDNKHLDHIVPLSNGGTNTICNVVYACARCNLSKGSKSLVDWLG